MKTEYQGIEIEYREQENDWMFELNGRVKSAGSLSLAKDTIRNAPKPKKPFQRFDALWVGYHGISRVTITSFVEADRYNTQGQYRFQSDGKRMSSGTENFAPLNNDNLAVQDRTKEITATIDALIAERDALKAKMPRMPPPEPTE